MRKAGEGRGEIACLLMLRYMITCGVRHIYGTEGQPGKNKRTKQGQD